MKSLGLYAHFPFCPQRCPYCGFAVVTGKDDLHERYATALCNELAACARIAPAEGLGSVFFGGGTPTRLAPRLLERILSTVGDSLGIAAGAEITVEANPGTTDAARYADLRQIGFNRISIGAQSFSTKVCGCWVGSTAPRMRWALFGHLGWPASTTSASISYSAFLE